MNILLLTRYFSNEVGGGYYLFSIIAELLAKNGHKVWVITNKVKGIENPKHDNIKIIFSSSQSIDEIQHWSQKNKNYENFMCYTKISSRIWRSRKSRKGVNGSPLKKS